MVSPIENLKNSLRIRILVWEIKIKVLVFTTNPYFSPIFLCFISQTGGNKELNQKDSRKYNNLITIPSSYIRNTSNTISVNKHGSNSLIVTLELSSMLLKLRDGHTEMEWERLIISIIKWVVGRNLRNDWFLFGNPNHLLWEV